MDPNECLRLLSNELLSREFEPEQVTEYTSALAGWLDSGGFEPAWGMGGTLTQAQFERCRRLPS